MAAQKSVNPFAIGPHDRIFLDEVEMTIGVDGRDSKAFLRKEGNGAPVIMDNAEIKAALDVGNLVVLRNANDPRRLELNASTPSLVRDLPERQQEVVGTKLLWIMLLRQMRAEMGGIPHERRPAIMYEIHARFVRDYKEMKRLGHFQNITIHHTKLPNLKVPPHDRVQQWSSKLDKAGGDARVLVDGRGSAARSSFTEEERHIQGQYVWRVCSNTEPNVDYLFRLMKAVERRLNRSRPSEHQLNLGSRSTFYNRVAAIPDFARYLGNHGEARARAKYNIVLGKDRGYPMDMVEADECRLDLVTLLKIIKVWEGLSKEVKEAYRKASQRFWASAVVDHSSGAFLSFRLHTRNPSVHTARAAFELAARDKSDIARAAGCRSNWPMAAGIRGVRLDAASWFKSTALTTTLTDAGASKFHPPVKQPWLRGTIERIFGILSGLTLQHFSGRTFSDVVKRGDRDPLAGASVDPVMLERVFVRAIVDIFHNIRSHGKVAGMSRRQAWFEGCEIQPPPPPLTGWQRRNVYGLNLERVVTPEGIEVMGFFYQSLEIQEMRRNKTKRKVNIRIDLWDLGEITAFDRNGRMYRVPARLDRLRGMSYWKATTLLQELEVIDVEYTNRTLLHVDEAIEAIDSYADVARMTHSIACPIITEEHVKRVEKRLTRGLRVVEESEYTKHLSDQDFSMTPFLADAWGIDDEPEPDDLDVAQAQSAEAVAAKYGKPSKPARKNAKSAAPVPAAPSDQPSSAPPESTAGDAAITYSARYTEEH